MPVVPWPVRIKVSLVCLLALACLALPWVWYLRGVGSTSFAAPIFIELFFLTGGLYVLWCLWPRFRLGIPRALNGEGDLLLPSEQAYQLTFDDGPTPELTDRILDLLQQHNIKATFFVLLEKARRCPALLQRMLSEGHQVGLHGANHRGPFGRSTQDLTETLTQAKQELEQLLGQPVALYRPSHGWKTPNLLRAAQAAGLKFCFWDFGVWDTDNPAIAVLRRRLDTALTLSESPPVLLLHDGLDDELTFPKHGETLLRVLQEWLPLSRDASLLEEELEVSIGSRRWASYLTIGIVTVACLYWLIRDMSWSSLISSIASIDPGALLMAGVCSVIANAFQGLRLYALYPAGLSLWRHVGLAFALHTGNILFSFRAGEILRPLLMKRWQPEQRIRSLVKWILFDRFIEAVTFLPFALIGAYFLLKVGVDVIPAKLWTLITLSVGGVVAALFILFRRHWARLLIGGVFSLGGWVFNGLAVWCLIPEMGQAVATLVGISLASALPSLPAGLGPFQAAFVFVSTRFGMGREQALAMAVGLHGIQILMTLSIGLAFLWRWGWPKPAKDFARTLAKSDQ